MTEAGYTTWIELDHWTSEYEAKNECIFSGFIFSFSVTTSKAYSWVFSAHGFCKMYLKLSSIFPSDDQSVEIYRGNKNPQKLGPTQDPIFNFCTPNITRKNLVKIGSVITSFCPI